MTYEEFKDKWVAEFSDDNKLPLNKCTCYIKYDYKFSFIKNPNWSNVNVELFICISNIKDKDLLVEFKKEAEEVGVNYQWMNGDYYKIINTETIH